MIDPAIFEGDPPVREDGCCYVCLKERHPERSKRYAGDIAKYDPFCSSTCAREYFGNPIRQQSIWGRPRRLEAA